MGKNKIKIINTIHTKIQISLIFSVLSFLNVNGQIIQSLQPFKGSINDGSKLMQAYLLPLEKSFNAFNHSGLIQLSPKNDKTKYTFKIFFQFMNNAITPQSDKQYDVNNLQLEEFKPSNPNKTIAQTFTGNENTIQLESKTTYRSPSTIFPFYTDKPILTFNTPKGMMNTMSFAAIGFGISNQSISFVIRSLPPLSLPGIDGKISLWGVAAQTKINKLFSKLESLPFDLMLTGGFERILLSVNPNLKPENSNNEEYNQEFFIKTNSIPIQIGISKNLTNRLGAFLSGGYNFAQSFTGLVGTYPLYKSDPTHNYNLTIDKIHDPIKFSRNNSNVFLNIGIGYYFKRVGFSGDFLLAKYKSISFKIEIFFQKNKN